MNRRNFLRLTVGGVAAGAAVRTWPFRVYSFPGEIKVVSPFDILPGPVYVYPSPMYFGMRIPIRERILLAPQFLDDGNYRVSGSLWKAVEVNNDADLEAMIAKYSHTQDPEWANRVRELERPWKQPHVRV